MKKTLLLIVIGLFFGFRSEAQTRVIEGVITDQNTGEELVGVNIYIKGTSIGAVSDINGAYKLKVKLGDIVVMSYVGMKTREILITNQNSLSPGMKYDLPDYKFTKYYNNKAPGLEPRYIRH